MGRVDYTLPIVVKGQQMLGKRLIASLLVCMTLAGCATQPNGDLDPRSCNPGGPGEIGGSDPLAALAAVLVVDLVFFAGCEAVVGITNGIHHFHPAQSRDGVYYSPDGVFSVGVPQTMSDEYQVQQSDGAGKDTVVFVPRTSGQPIYGVTVLTHLEGAQAALSLADFASQASANLPGVGMPVAQIHTEDVQLGANPARLVVYRSQAPVGGAPQQDYYFMYFVKTAHTAAILSVTWPYECPRCADASDAAIRDMDPALGSFVSSFELSSQTR